MAKSYKTHRVFSKKDKKKQIREKRERRRKEAEKIKLQQRELMRRGVEIFV